MNDNDRKFGTKEVLKECCHTKALEKCMPHCTECGADWVDLIHTGNRTFTNPDDAYALEQALVRDGKFSSFKQWCMSARGIYWDLYNEMLPEQRCQLIIDFYKEQVNGM
jgi:hypothetical protein